MTEYEHLNVELREAGVHDFLRMGEKGEPIDTLVNSRISSYPYLDILLKYLPKLTGNEQEMVVRALTEKKNKKAASHLLNLLRAKAGLSEANLWAIGNALYTIDNKNTYPEILNLCRDSTLGIGRSMLFLLLPRIRTEEALNILLDNLSDPKVKGHVIEALGRFGDFRILEILENTSVDKTKYEFKAKRTALKRLRTVGQKSNKRKL